MWVCKLVFETQRRMKEAAVCVAAKRLVVLWTRVLMKGSLFLFFVFSSCALWVGVAVHRGQKSYPAIKKKTKQQMQKDVSVHAGV